jgi:hypothetical protein
MIGGHYFGNYSGLNHLKFCFGPIEDVIDPRPGGRCGRRRCRVSVHSIGPLRKQFRDGCRVWSGVHVAGKDGCDFVAGEEAVDLLGFGEPIFGNVVLKMSTDEAKRFVPRSGNRNCNRAAGISRPLGRTFRVREGVNHNVEDGKTREDGVTEQAPFIMLGGTEAYRQSRQLGQLSRFMDSA